MNQLCIYIYSPFFFKVSFPYRPLQNIEPSSLCCTVGSLLVICFIQSNVYIWAFQVALLVKNPPADAGRDPRDLGSIPGSGRSPEGGNGNPLQYSCLGYPLDREAWQAAVHGVAKELDMTLQLNNDNVPSTCIQAMSFSTEATGDMWLLSH